MIINMSSVAGLKAWAGTGTYSASKHGIMALTKSLADEGRPHHIKVSAICPGAVTDDLVDASLADIEHSEKIDPFDVAEAAIYLSALGKHAVGTRSSLTGQARIGEAPRSLKEYRTAVSITYLSGRSHDPSAAGSASQPC